MVEIVNWFRNKLTRTPSKTPEPLPSNWLEEDPKIVITPRDVISAAHHYFNNKIFDVPDRPSNEVVDVLPSLEINGKKMDFKGVVNSKLKERESRGDKTPVRVVDVGYGGGQFLLQCRDIWGERLELVAYGSSDEPASIKEDSGRTRKDVMVDAGIKFVDGNVIDIHRKLKNQKTDLLVSSYAMRYVNFPPISTIRRLYRSLNQDGVALISWGSSIFKDEEGYATDSVRDYVSRHTDIPFFLSNVQIAFQRTRQDLGLRGISHSKHVRNAGTKRRPLGISSDAPVILKD